MLTGRAASPYRSSEEDIKGTHLEAAAEKPSEAVDFSVENEHQTQKQKAMHLGPEGPPDSAPQHLYYLEAC